MSFERFYNILGRMRVDVEAAGSFCTDGTGTLGNFEDVPYQAGSCTLGLTRDMYDPQIVQQSKDQRSVKEPGQKTWSLTFSHPVASTGTAAGSAVQATTDVLGTLLGAVMGLESRSTGTTVNDAGAAVTDYDLAATTGWLAGMWSGTTIAGAVQWRGVKTLSGSNIIHKIATTAAPSNGSVVYGVASYSMTEDPTTTLQFIVQGAGSADSWVLLGGQGGYSVTINESGLATQTWTFTGPKWLNGSEAVCGALTLAAATYPTLGYPQSQAGAFLSQTVGTATYTDSAVSGATLTEGTNQHVAGETWNVGISYQMVTSPSGTEGRIRQVRQMGAPLVSGSFKVPYAAFATWFSARDNKTVKAFSRQLGTAAGSTVILEAPTAQITNVQPVDAGGMAYVEVAWEGRADSATAGATVQQLSAARYVRA